LQSRQSLHSGFKQELETYIQHLTREKLIRGPIYPKEPILKIVKMPRPMRMVWGSLMAYWLSDIINPAFVAIAVLIVLYIPILVIDPYFPSRPKN